MAFVASTASNFKNLVGVDVSTNVLGVRIVNVAITKMDASGSAVHEFVEQDAVVISGIHYQFDISLNLQQSCNLLNSFDVSGNGPNDGFAVQLAADAGNGVSGRDMLANILADALDQQAVVAAAGDPRWAGKAIGGSEAGESEELTEMLQKDLWMGLVDVIRSDGLINTVEDVLEREEVTVTVDASGAALICANELAGSQTHRNILYTQIPQTTLAAYMDASEDTITGALPLKDLDVITFVFDVDMPTVQPQQQRQISMTGGQSAETNASGGQQPAVPAGYVPSNDADNNKYNVFDYKIFYDMGPRRLALNLRVTNPGAPVAGERFPVSDMAARQPDGSRPSVPVEAGKLRAASFRPKPLPRA